MCVSGLSWKTASGWKANRRLVKRKVQSCAWVAARPAALPRALEAIAHADLIVLGPGSLYTSLLPNLLVPELVEAIGRSHAPIAAVHLQFDDTAR